MLSNKNYKYIIVLCCFLTFGLSTGFTYYNIMFFFDYWSKPLTQGGFGWAIEFITLGLPIGVLLSAWLGPVMLPRFSPKIMMAMGIILMSIAFYVFGNMNGSTWQYFTAWFLFISGYTLAGPVPHQVIITNWFCKNRGLAMGIAYIGIAVVGWAGTRVAPYLVEHMDHNEALTVMSGLILIALPIIFIFLKDTPSPEQIDSNEFVALNDKQTDENQEALNFKELLAKPNFWLLLLGSAASIGSIAVMNVHLKFILLEQGFTSQEGRNEIWATAQGTILLSSIIGRLAIGKLADIFSKRMVMIGVYAMVAVAIPLVFLVTPESIQFVYLFAVVFGIAMGGDYMIIPLMANELFGKKSLSKSMSLISVADTISLAALPRIIASLKNSMGGYDSALWATFGFAGAGATAIMLIKNKSRNKTSRKK